MDYEALKIILAIFCSTGGVLWTVNKISIAYINRNQNKELTLKGGDFELHTKGLTLSEAEILFKQLPTNLLKKRNGS